MTGRPGTMTGYSGKINGISDYKNVSIITAPNFNKDYQKVYSSNNQVFKRQKGAFTKWFDNLKTQKFISTPFKKSN